MMRGLAFCAALALALALPAAATAACRQALAMGLDVSGSVDGVEYRLQLDGLAAALNSEPVRGALLEGPGAVRIAVYEWSGPQDHRMLQDWVEIDGPGTLDAVVARLRGIQRVRAEPTTAIGAAMALGGQLLNQQADCWQRTLDLSGDGKSNTGPRPQDMAEMPGVTVNGLVVGAEPEVAAARRLVEIGELVAYYDAYVIRGPNAFVEAALGFGDYEAAMTRKLLRELQSLAIGKRPGNNP
ncbi:DUF1194 domain-containing protein [Roseisalinus antarcticus]|uniref:VWFA domain-containing protein n=1 Tax=Roseisalinus antarcticus TaxID=254357 RepID=A0A1Y5SUB9_9RHOB|nr:DUF1194 domain-containing protein [Roseisalinus antarcticus]SLN48039.1 hypothetical protein ROA7023_02058 [Roseisalinus antarcticus]